MTHTVSSFEGCRQVMEHPAALIPPVQTDGLHAPALALMESLARLSNPPAHAEKRAETSRRFQQIQPFEILEECLQPGCMDFVSMVGKRLPAMMIVRGLECDERIVDCLPDLVKIMLPEKTVEDITAINKAVAVIPDVHLAALLIQSHHAGNALLSNALVHMMQYNRIDVASVLATDPPVLMTRRLAGEDMLIEGQVIPKGTIMHIELKHLPFGAGIHQCIAQHFMMDMTIKAMEYITHRFEQVRLIEDNRPHSLQIELL